MSNMSKVNSFLRLFLGVVFILAGTYRLFNWPEAISELFNLGFNPSNYLITAIICLEIIGGILLILNIKIKLILIAFIIFIIGAIISAFISNGYIILYNIKELFVFNPNPTDTLLHLIYLSILIYLLKNK